MARLQHPHIVQIHEVGEQAGVYYLVLEYLEGGSLDRRLASTPQEPTAAARLAEALARAVDHAHRRGILHRDLKPANVLLDAAGHAARSPTSAWPSGSTGDSGLTASGQVMGTPSYMAPEQARGNTGERHRGHRRLRPGRDPLRDADRPAALQGADSPVRTLEQVRDPGAGAARRGSSRRIPRDLETICLKCLEKEPDRRYASAEALADDLGRFLAGQPIVARPAGVSGRVRKWARRRPIEACLTAAVLGVTVLGLTGIVWQWRDALARRDTARREWYRANLVAAEAALQLHNSSAARRNPRDGARTVPPVGVAPLP